MAGRPREFERPVALDRAMRVFWSRGYAGAAVADLLDAMEIGRQSLYDAFGDKRALFLEALDLYGTTQFAWLPDLLGRPGSALANLRAVLDAWAAAVTRRDFTGCLICVTLGEFGRSDPDIARICDRHNARIERAFREALERARAHGEIAPDAEPAALARLLANTGIGLAVQGRRGLSRAAARDICDMAERALRPTVPRTPPPPG